MQDTSLCKFISLTEHCHLWIFRKMYTSNAYFNMLNMFIFCYFSDFNTFLTLDNLWIMTKLHIYLKGQICPFQRCLHHLSISFRCWNTSVSIKLYLKIWKNSAKYPYATLNTWYDPPQQFSGHHTCIPS